MALAEIGLASPTRDDAGGFLHVVTDILRPWWKIEEPNMAPAGRITEQSALDKRRTDIQRQVAEFSQHLHLSDGFASSLGREFAALLNEDDWDPDDTLPTGTAVEAFLKMLRASHPTRVPGIGSNGRGSVTAFWVNGKNRLTVTCLPSGNLSWVVTRFWPEKSETVRTAGECRPDRLRYLLAPYKPRIWFDG